MASQSDRVALFATIRREARDGTSKRAIARKYQVSRKTVDAAIASAWPARVPQLVVTRIR